MRGDQVTLEQARRLEAGDCLIVIYGTAELATKAGISERTLSAYLSRGKCPEPSYRLKCGPVWEHEHVAAWLEAREQRLERLIADGDQAHELEVSAAAEYVYQAHLKDKRETARRNVHNGRLAKYRVRTGLENGTLKREGIIPTLRAESRSIAERLVATEGAALPGYDEAMRRRDWAASLATNRHNRRIGATDGIPF